MTPTLTHPPAEDLGRFVEGTLDAPGRATIVAHIADCDECRIDVVDAAEFVEPIAEHWDPRRWLAVAATIVVVATGAGFFYNQTRDRLAKTKETYGQLPNRPITARLSGFPYVPRKTFRSGSQDDDPMLDIMKGEAVDAVELRGHSAKVSDERGIGLVLTDRANEGIASLEEATKREPNNPRYLSDLAAALIVAGGPEKLQRAVQACDQALRIDSRMPEALFNRAIALQALDQTEEAIKAFKLYLAVDSSSKWADEVRTNLDLLLPQP
jgi:tetratricopeptide (TPR) repeat protein